MFSRRNRSRSSTALVLAAIVTVSAPSCSVYMESTRPTPVDLSQFDPGQTRDSVLERLGSPQDTVKESDGSSCDMYELYTRGYGAGGKIPIAIAEGAADFFTLGLAEILLTPTEGVTKNGKHPVTFCYKDQKVVRITTPGTNQTEEAAATAADSERAPAPSAPAKSSPAAELSPSAQSSPAATAPAAESQVAAKLPTTAAQPTPISALPPATTPSSASVVPEGHPAVSSAAAPTASSPGAGASGATSGASAAATKPPAASSKSQLN
jgi:hypothetical protein